MEVLERKNNPVLPGQFADPDIAVFGNRYYMYPTTDGFPGWSGTVFHAFSSENLVDWTDEGIILDVGKGKDVPWSVGSAWAPAIAEKNGVFYFYFCAKDETGTSHVGVAKGETPTGPFQAMEQPLVTVAQCNAHGIELWQAIDPSVFTDEDGHSYLLFGNGAPVVVELQEDMMGIKEETLHKYEGVVEFREAITVTKRKGKYHFTWSCDDTGSSEYHVNYGTSDSIYGPIEFKDTILEKRPECDILGTGHHCILQIPDEDEYYIAYHRFFTPLDRFTEGKGFHREVCIDRLYFGKDGLMEQVIPTVEGVRKRVLSK